MDFLHGPLGRHVSPPTKQNHLLAVDFEYGARPIPKLGHPARPFHYQAWYPLETVDPIPRPLFVLGDGFRNGKIGALRWSM